LRIALDTMGGDHGPKITVHGAYRYLQSKPGATIVLLGDREQIQYQLNMIPEKYHSSLPVVHAPEIISMSESPLDAIRKKKNSSMVVGLDMHKKGEVEAFVSAGNTGAQMAGSLLQLGRISNVKRPAIGAFLPSERGMVYIIDVGANVDSRPGHLLQFAMMAEVFVAKVFSGKNLRTGLLSNGEEAAKGNDLTVSAHKLLKENIPGFIGNIEGGDIFKGKTDIIVCDGFMGNVLLKMAESVMGVILNGVRKNIGKNLMRNVGALLVQPAFKALKQSFNYEEYGGVPLLGVDGISVICHGKSSSTAIKNALRVAKSMREKDVNNLIKEKLTLDKGKSNAQAG